MDKNAIFLQFLNKFKDNKPLLVESITKAFKVIYESNSTEEQIELIKKKLSAEKLEEISPDNATGLDSLVPEENDDSIELELKDLDKLY